MELVRPNNLVVWQDLPDTELVLLHPTSGVYYGVNATGAQIWRALATGPRSVADLAAGLSAGFGIDVARATDDVAGLIADLRAADLVTAGPVAATG